jgi:hypothetical protein
MTAPVTYEPAQRGAGRDLLAEGVEGGGHHLRLERPRGYGVHRDPARTELLGQHAGEVVQGGLRRRVRVGVHRRDVQAVDAAHVHDARGVIIGAGLLQQRQEGPREEERRLEVEVDDLVPCRRRELLHRRRPPRGTGVVDEDVQLVLPLADLLGQPDALLLAGEVGRDRDDLAVRGEFGDSGVTGLGLA